MAEGNNEVEYTLKISIIGDLGVGKTSLIKRFVEGKFTIDYLPTIGTNMFTTRIAFTYNGSPIKARLNIYDIAGHESWKSMRHIYYKGTQGLFIVGDLTRKETFNKILTYWIKDVEEYIEPPIPYILLANKSDLHDLLEVEEKEIKELKERIGAKEYLITSAKTGDNVRKAFEHITRYCIFPEENS